MSIIYVYFIADCHAEIVSRRCLVDFLYRHLELHLEDGDVNNQSIFVKKSDGSGYNLKVRRITSSSLSHLVDHSHKILE